MTKEGMGTHLCRYIAKYSLSKYTIKLITYFIYHLSSSYFQFCGLLFRFNLLNGVFVNCNSSKTMVQSKSMLIFYIFFFLYLIFVLFFLLQNDVKYVYTGQSLYVEYNTCMSCTLIESTLSNRPTYSIVRVSIKYTTQIQDCHEYFM